jgi:hypothetical protein
MMLLKLEKRLTCLRVGVYESGSVLGLESVREL